MRNIPIRKWNNGNLEQSTLGLIGTIFSGMKLEDMPKGLEQFRLFSRLDNAFREAENTGTIHLEEADYALLKRIVEKHVPAIWAMNKNLSETIDLIVNAEEVKLSA